MVFMMIHPEVIQLVCPLLSRGNFLKVDADSDLCVETNKGHHAVE